MERGGVVSVMLGQLAEAPSELAQRGDHIGGVPIGASRCRKRPFFFVRIDYSWVKNTAEMRPLQRRFAAYFGDHLASDSFAKKYPFGWVKMSKYSAKSTNIEESDAPNGIGRERPILFPGIGRRIDAAAKLIGTRESAAKAAGISTDSLGYYVKEIVEPKLKNMAMLAKAAGVSLDWLVFGDGRGIQEPVAPYGAAIEDDFALVPLYDVRASAGHGAINGNERILARMAFRRDWMRQTMGVSEDEVALVPVEGDSMEPTLPAGAVVLVDMREASRQVTREGVYLIRMDDGLMVKRAQRLPGRLRITSDNPAYKPFELDLNAEHPEAEILGRVIWNGHPM